MKTLLAIAVFILSMNGPIYTDILGHINCQNAVYEHQYMYENTTTTICRFKEGTLVFTRYKDEDVQCVAYMKDGSNECPEALEVF